MGDYTRIKCNWGHYSRGVPKSRSLHKPYLPGIQPEACPLKALCSPSIDSLPLNSQPEAALHCRCFVFFGLLGRWPMPQLVGERATASYRRAPVTWATVDIENSRATFRMDIGFCTGCIFTCTYIHNTYTQLGYSQYYGA